MNSSRWGSARQQTACMNRSEHLGLPPDVPPGADASVESSTWCRIAQVFARKYSSAGETQRRGRRASI